MWDSLERRTSAMRTGASRRELLRQTGILTLAGALPAAGQPARNVTASTDKAGEIYRSIGVSPLINARGTFTIITGSQSLPRSRKRWKKHRTATSRWTSSWAASVMSCRTHRR